MRTHIFSETVADFDTLVLNKDFTSLNEIYKNSGNLMPFFQLNSINVRLKKFFDSHKEMIRESFFNNHIFPNDNLSPAAFVRLIRKDLEPLISSGTTTLNLERMKSCCRPILELVSDIELTTKKAQEVAEKVGDVFQKIPEAKTLDELVSLFRLIGGDYIFVKTRKEHILRHISAKLTHNAEHSELFGQVLEMDTTEKELLNMLDLMTIKKLLTLVVDNTCTHHKKIKSTFFKLDNEEISEFFSHVSQFYDVQIRGRDSDILLGSDNNNQFKIARDITLAEKITTAFIGDRVKREIGKEELMKSMTVSVGRTSNGARVKKDAGLMGEFRVEKRREEDGTPLGKNCYGLNTMFVRGKTAITEENIERDIRLLSDEKDILHKLDDIDGFDTSSSVILKAERYAECFEEIRLLSNSISCAKAYQHGMESGELKSQLIKQQFQNFDVKDIEDGHNRINALKNEMEQIEAFFSDSFNVDNDRAIIAIKTVIKVHLSSAGVRGRMKTVETLMSNLTEARKAYTDPKKLTSSKNIAI